MPTRAYQFGDWLVEPDQNRIRSRTTERHLEPQSMDILCHLLESAGDTVSTESLLASVWGGRVVEGNAVPRAINLIRRALDDNSQDPSYIETIRKRGYRTIASVEKIDRRPQDSNRVAYVIPGVLALAIALASAWLYLANTGVERHSDHSSSRVAVLPFRDLSRQRDLQWLADALQIRLAQIIGSSSDHQLVPTPLATRMLRDGLIDEVDLLLTGTLQREPSQLSSTINLIEVGSREQIWSETFLGQSTDLFDYQQRMALRIARYFNTTIDDGLAPTAKPAWRPYLKYLHFQWGGSFDQEVYWLERALQADPDWTRGWQAMTTQLIRRAAILKDQKWIARAKRAAENTCRSSHVKQSSCRLVRGEVAMFVDGDLELAERAFRELAIHHDIGITYALLMLFSGLHQGAANSLQRIAEQQPFLPIAHDWLSVARGIEGDIERALIAAEDFARLLPESSVVPDLGRGILLAKSGQLDLAEKTADRFSEEAYSPDAANDYEVFRLSGYHIASAKVASMRMDRDKAKGHADELVKLEALDFAAAIYLELGDEEVAARLFESAATRPQFQRRVLAHVLLYLDREFHDHLLVQNYMARLGFSARWREEVCERASRSMPSAGIITCADGEAQGEEV